MSNACQLRLIKSGTTKIIDTTGAETKSYTITITKSSLPCTGHNFADGSIFGNIDLLIAGDRVILYTPEEANGAV